MELQEVAEKEFLVGLRGYVKEDVRVYLRAVSDELVRREELIADLRGKLEKARGELADAQRRLDEANGQTDFDRATLVRLVGQEASAILSTADGVAERIRLEAERYSESVRDGAVSTRTWLVELHQSLGEFLAEFHRMEQELAGSSKSSETDVVLLGPDRDDSCPPDEIPGQDELVAPEANGEAAWPWGGR